VEVSVQLDGGDKLLVVVGGVAPNAKVLVDGILDVFDPHICVGDVLVNVHEVKYKVVE
jgi:hypothetical protein